MDTSRLSRSEYLAVAGARPARDRAVPALVRDDARQRGGQHRRRDGLAQRLGRAPDPALAAARAALAPIILAWIIVRGHELSWARGEMTAVVRDRGARPRCSSTASSTGRASRRADHPEVRLVPGRSLGDPPDARRLGACAPARPSARAGLPEPSEHARCRRRRPDPAGPQPRARARARDRGRRAGRRPPGRAWATRRPPTRPPSTPCASSCTTVHMDGVVVIGEGEKDEAPMLYNGEHIGDGSPPQVDIAVDPLEGTTPDGEGHAERAGGHRAEPARDDVQPGPRRLHGEAGRRPGHRRPARPRPAAGRDAARSSPSAAASTSRDIMVVVLDRPRHEEGIDEIRERGRARAAHHRRRRQRRAAGGQRPLARRPAVGHRRHARGRHLRGRDQVHRRRARRPAVAARRRRAPGRARRRATTSTASSRRTTSCAATTASSRRPA